MSKPKRVYISGQITGLDIKVATDYFENTERQLHLAGAVPVNPMKVLPYDAQHSWVDYMAADLAALLTCDAIFMLDNYTNSKGARVELAVARELGLEIYHSKNHNFF